MRRNLALGALAGLGTLALVAACSKGEQAAGQASKSEPAATATFGGAASASAVPPVFPADPNAAPAVVPPAEEPSPAPTGNTAHSRPPPPAPKAITPSPAATVGPASQPSPKPKPDDDGLHATPAPSLGVKKVAVLANNHYTCSSTEKRDNVSAMPEPRGARISIVGQGPCPGEVHDWSAQVTQQRVEVHGTHGSASKCRCVGSGELVLRGLDPGTYDIAVNGGFDRPIATRITVLQ